MADYVLIRKSRNMLSSFLHFFLNILLGVGSIVITNITGTWMIGVALVALSKWRIFAVRPRYWMLNVKSALVDIIVGVSLVLIAYCSGTDWMFIHTVLAILYSVWLIFIKPKSSDLAAETQAVIAMGLGATAATLMCASSDSYLIVIICGLIGYAAARHVLVQSDDNNFAMITLSSALISAEIAWLCHSWLIVYTFGNSGIIIPQLAILLSIFTFVFNKVYRSVLKHDGKLRFAEISAPLIFSILIIITIVVWFSKPIFNI